MAFLLSVTSSRFVSSSLPFPTYDHYPYALPSTLLMVSFTPPLHPSNLGRQQNNIHRVMVTGSPPSRGYFLLLSLVLLPIGSYTLLTAHIMG